MRLMSIVTASVMIGATTGLSSTRASAQNCVAGSSTPTGTFTWTYESGSNRKSSLAYPNGATTAWSYNNRGELTSVENRHADGTAISTYDYTYDAAGRRISKNDECYGYNARSELTQATSISDPNFHAAYQFDDIGNRETSAEFGIRSGEYTYTANELNQYASIVDENAVDSAAPSDATFTPTYDADGNQTLVKTKTGIWQVTYNAENRPVKWTCGTTNLVMAFDRMGRRVLSEVQVNDAPIKTETYVYDGYTCILRQTTIHTNDAPTTIRDTFIWDPTEPVATRPLVWNRVEEKGSSQQVHPTAFYFHDGNKNVSDVVAATDETKAHYTYAPFGDCTATGSLAESNPWRFSSEYADDEIGCVYYNYRPYEPVTGRWVGRDPLFARGEMYFVLSLYAANVYAFVGNGVTFLTDFLGREANLINRISVPPPMWSKRPILRYLPINPKDVYGNYCGSCNINGLFFKGSGQNGWKPEEIGEGASFSYYDENKILHHGKGPAPKDEIDRCCMRHDQCLAVVDNTKYENSFERSKSVKICDISLALCWLRAGDKNLEAMIKSLVGAPVMAFAAHISASVTTVDGYIILGADKVYEEFLDWVKFLTDGLKDAWQEPDESCPGCFLKWSF